MTSFSINREIKTDPAAERHLSAYVETANVFFACLEDLKKGAKADFSPVKDKILHLVSLIKEKDRFLMGFANSPYSVLVKKSLVPPEYAGIVLYGVNLAVYSLSISIEIRAPEDHLPYIGLASICNHINMMPADAGSAALPSKHALPDIPSKLAFGDIDKESILLLSGLVNHDGSEKNKAIAHDSMHQYAVLINLCSTFEKLTHRGIGNLGVPPIEAMKILRDGMDNAFNRNIVKIVFDKFSIYPVGTFARLNTRETVKIVDTNPGMIMRPVVMIVLDDEDREKLPPCRINLREKPTIYIKHPVQDEALAEKFFAAF